MAGTNEARLTAVEAQVAGIQADLTGVKQLLEEGIQGGTTDTLPTYREIITTLSDVIAEDLSLIHI